MKVLIIGSNGQLGTDLTETFSKKHDVFSMTHTDIDVEDLDGVKNVFTSIKPDLVLNTAAFHDVPRCEEDPIKSYMVNSIGAFNISLISQEIGAINVYYSTDYVFDGNKKKPYTELDNPNPLNVYAITKLAGENYTINYSEKHYVLRISGIYGKVPCRAKNGNFISKIITASKEKDEIKVVRDEILTPTSTSVISMHTLKLINSNKFGLYHFTCEGETSWYEFTKVIFDTLDIKTPLSSTTVAEFPSKIKRPFYSVLSNKNYNNLNLDKIAHWKDTLINFLRENYL